MIFGVTGHRDAGQKAGELEDFARLIAARMIDSGCTLLMTGVARGWDLAITEAFHERQVPFIAVIPFASQARYWHSPDRTRYRALLEQAKSVWIGSPVELKIAYLQRDKLIVQSCDHLWALNSGRPSGSNTTVLFAQKIGCKVTDLWADWVAFQQEKSL